MRLLFLMLCLTISAMADSAEPQMVSKKVVLITGCSRGIGLATAELLANKGYVVYATAITLSDPPFCSSLHKNLYFKLLDVTDPFAVRTIVNEIIENEGCLDILINNAGFALGGPLECLFMEEIIEQMNVNFFGAIRTCQEVLPHMRKQRSGHIINISSEQGLYGLPYGSLYTSSKAALESF